MNYSQTSNNLEKQLRDYVGDGKAIIGISGGIDSAVVSSLCVRALGKENVFGVLMPYGNQDMQDARDLVKFLNVNSEEVNIKKIVDDFNFLDLNELDKGNVMARIRMTLLYSFANHLEGMVIGTGNKSELEIGYFTKYGDGGVDVEPLGDLYKTEVYELAKYLEIPKRIIGKKPSAGLWENQTDEEELGLTYKQIDMVLKGELNKGEVYEKVQKLRRNSEHKRNMPPVFEVKR
jgi:NAD+ synthase